MHQSMRVLLILTLLIVHSLSFSFKQQQPSYRSASASLTVSPNASQKQLKSTYTIFQSRYSFQNLPANSVIYLRGDNCNLTWAKGVPMKKAASPDIWSTSLLCPSGIKISVKLLVNDTKWMMGANHVFTITNQSNPYIIIYPSFAPQINSIFDSQPIHSSILNNSRKISIYYPPSYFDNKLKTYQLLLMHDGQNLFDNSKAAFGTAWMCQNTANLYISQGKIREIVIVGIWNTNNRNNQYTYSYDQTEKMGGKGDLYLDFIQQQLMPKLKNQYLIGRIDTTKPIGIGGSSLGGLISCYAAYTRPNIYKKAICMSSSFWWNNQDFRNIILKSKPYDSSTTLYIDSGDSGPGSDNKVSTDNARTALINKGYILNKNLYAYLDVGGQHSQKYWGMRFWVPLTYLYAAG